MEKDDGNYKDQFEYSICPNCKRYDSFDFKFENIEEALKRKG